MNITDAVVTTEVIRLKNLNTSVLMCRSTLQT